MKKRYVLIIITALITSCQFNSNERIKEVDSDGDGVYDSMDECLETYGLEEFNGCPDTDQDGIPDHEDECPETYGLEELNGCPEIEAPPEDPRLTAAECYKILSLTSTEIKAASDILNVGLDDLISFESCEIISDYILEYREIKRDQARLQKQIDGGYIQTVWNGGERLGQYLIVLKGGVYFLMEVVAGGDCSMGTMEFNENTSSLQDVLVRESPDIGEFRGFKMRIIDKSTSFNTLNNKLTGL